MNFLIAKNLEYIIFRKVSLIFGQHNKDVKQISGSLELSEIFEVKRSWIACGSTSLRHLSGANLHLLKSAENTDTKLEMVFRLYLEK